MRSATWLYCAAVVAVLWGGQPCSADFQDTAEFSLGPATPSPDGQQVSFAVNVTFTTVDPSRSGYQATQFILDITASSPDLSPGGDYSAWSFSRNAPVNAWTDVIFQGGGGAGFNNNLFPGEVWFEDEEIPPTQGLSQGTYQLGTLTYDLSKFGLTSSSTLMVAISMTDSGGNPLTTLGDENPSPPPTNFELAMSTFDGPQAFPGGGGGTPTAPAPSGLVLAGIGSALLTVAGLVRRRLGRSGPRPS